MSRRAVHPSRVGARFFWLTLAAMVIGCGMYGTHLAAMLAFHGRTPPRVDTELSNFAIFVAFSATWLGAGLALWRPRCAIIGGAIVSGGAFAMHYMGMAAMQLPAAVQWDAGYVGASVAIGMVLGAVALEITVTSRRTGRRFLGAALMAFAVVGLHFTIMVAGSQVHSPVPLPRGKIDYAAMGPEHAPRHEAPVNEGFAL